jgi:ABC-2 type transport system permease protein
MSWRHSAAVVRHDLRVLRTDPTFLVVMTCMPLVVMAFVKAAFRPSLVEEGVVNANGAEQAVPGTTVLFAFFLVGNVGFNVFREHGWNTWERLRASRATPGEVMAGKVVTPLLSLALQLTVLFVAGGLLFGLRVRGSTLGLVVVSVALAVCLVSMGLVLLSLCRTVMQLNAISNLGTMVLAGLGGALTPLSGLPGWARDIAPATPSYWAMRGYRSMIVGGEGLGAVALPVGVLMMFTVGFLVLARLRFRYDDTKVAFA